MGINSGAVFPAFLKVEYDESADGFAKFKSDIAGIDGAMAPARASLKQFGNDIEAISREAVRLATTSSRDQFGAASYRQAADASRQRAEAARDMTNALIRAAEAEQDYSASTRLSIAASDAAAREFEDAAAAAAQQALTMERLERVMASNSTIAKRFVDANASVGSALTRTSAAASGTSFALVNAGQQVQDIAVGFASGQRGAVIFAQQLPQLGFALSTIEATGSRSAAALAGLGRFLVGPWGTALTVGAIAIGVLTDAFSSNADATKEVKIGTDAMAEAQSALAGVFDLVTGKVKEQNQFLINNAALKASALKAEAAAGRISSQQTLGSIGVSTSATIAGLFGGTVGSLIGGNYKGASGRAEMLRQLEAGRQSGQISFSDALLAAEKLNFDGLKITREQYVQALANENSANQADAAATDIRKSLRTGVLDSDLRRDAPKRRPKVDRSAERLENANESALARIADINRAWDEQPKLIDRAANSAEDLVSIIKDADEKLKAGKLTTGQRDELEKTKQAAREAAATISEGLNRPYNDLIQSQQDALAVQRLTTEGRYEEAEALQQILRLQRDGVPVDEARAQAILDNVAALRQAQREQQRLNEIQGYYLNALGEIRGGLREAFATGKPGSIFSSFGRAFKNLSADLTVEKLFGPIFRQMEDQITGAGKVRKANEAFAGQLNDLSTKSTRLGSETDKVTLAFERLRNTLDTINGVSPAALAASPSEPAAAANDNPEDIVVVARKILRNQDASGIADLPGPITFIGTVIQRSLAQFLGSDSPVVTTFGKVAGFFSKLESGGVPGGILGADAGKSLGKTIGGSLGDKLSEFSQGLGPFAAAVAANQVIGDVFGFQGGPLGVFTGLVSSVKRGSATIGGGANGDLVITGYSGNSKSRKKAAGEGAQASIESIQKIAEALGGEVTGNGTVSIGIRKGSYRVDTTGQGITKTKKGAIDFGEDAEAAVKFATLDLIKDGVIAGLRASTQRILQQGKDLDSALEKAVDFESVFKRLKAYKDPVGAALDTLDAEFKHLKGIFAEAGADASEYAQLEELYGIERAKAIKEAGEAVTASLRSLLDDLTVGNDARSLRERKGIAQAAYDPLAARVAAGDTTAYDAYADAARQLLDIERQISGSTKDYFDLLDQITGLTGKAVQDQTNIDSISASRPGLFDTNTSAPVVSAVDQQTQLLAGILNGQFNAVNDNFGVTIRQNEQIIQLMSGTRGSLVDNYVRNF